MFAKNSRKVENGGDMKPEEYVTWLERNGKKIPEENKKKMLEAMKKYGDNHWWDPDYPIELAAYYQLKEKTLIIDFGRFHEGTEKLLGRPVWTHEFALNYNGLLKEAEEAFERLMKGESLERDPKYVAAKVRESIELLLKFAKKHNKPVILIEYESKDDQQTP